jgi:predicted TIM-barrel fold metal-dependent hydrolase
MSFSISPEPAKALENPMSNVTPKIVDFHSHYVGPSFPLTTLARVPQAQRAHWQGVNDRLTDPDALIASVESSGIAARVINTPLEFVQDADGKVQPGTIGRINDAVAELVSRHPGRLYGLATIDAYSGEAGANELTRAVEELGLRGVFIESAKGDLLPDAKEARPTFAAAAALGVPVFLHPVADPQMKSRFKSCGRLGERLVRSTINSAALFVMLESGMFEEIPNLRVVVTALALGGVFLAECFGDGSRLREGETALARRQVYIDTTGLHPVMVRSAIELLGADHVLMGTDWPVVVESSLPQRMQAILAACRLDIAEQHMVAGGNTLKLLGVAVTSEA